MVHAKFLSNLKQIGTVYHISNILLCISYYFSRVLTPVCRIFYGPDGKCVIGQREYEIFLLLAVIIYIKNRKSSKFFSFFVFLVLFYVILSSFTASFMHYLSNVFIFGKLANFFMFYYSNPSYAIIYAVLAIVLLVLFPEPAYKGPENVTYFRGPNLKEEIDRDKRVVWVVEFFAGWSPLCRQVTPVFAELSNEYALKNLRFAKMDISRYPKEAEKFRINIHPASRQLPTISLFQNGKEVKRRPTIDPNHRAVPYVFKKENVIFDFDLNTVYAECKANLSKKDLESVEKEKKTN